MLEIFLVRIDFRLARFGRWFQKFDKFQFRKLRICWFLFQNEDSYTCWDISVTKTRRWDGFNSVKKKCEQIIVFMWWTVLESLLKFYSLSVKLNTVKIRKTWMFIYNCTLHHTGLIETSFAVRSLIETTFFLSSMRDFFCKSISRFDGKLSRLVWKLYRLHIWGIFRNCGFCFRFRTHEIVVFEIYNI